MQSSFKRRLERLENRNDSFFSNQKLKEIFPNSQEMRDKTRRHICGINSSKEFLKLFYDKSDWSIQKAIQTFINRS